MQVCDAAFDQTLAKVVPDGIGGACVVWDDRRNGTNADIYGQRVDAFGQIPDQCVSPTDLVSSTPQTTSAPLNYRTFHQVDFYWSAVGVRGSGGDWDLEMYDTDSYGLQPYPTCFGLPMAGSYSTSQVDFIVEDSNDNITPPGIYGVRAYRYSGTGNALLEWDGGTSELFPNTAGVGSNVAGWTGLLDTYDINLTAGVEYYFKLTTNNPSAQVKVFLFTSLGHAFTNDFKYVVPRSARVAESSGQWMIYTAQGTDYYGIVVLNENGAPVDYTLQAFTSGVAGVHPDGPADLATRLMGLAPNPSSGRVNLAFSLREPASVSFDVLDMAGRVVNRITSQRWEAGTWSVGWDGRRSQGTEAPPGIYFVQMRVDGRPIGLSRLALIR